VAGGPSDLQEVKVPWGHKPGVQNWVERYDALKPKGTNWIRRTAEHLHGKGWTTGRSIATAVNAAKKMCATGDTNFPGKQEVNPGSRAEACEAVRIWEAAKAQARAARVSEVELRIDRDLPQELKRDLTLSFNQLRTIRAPEEFPSALIHGLVLLSDEEPIEALAEAVAIVRRWAYGINDAGEPVSQTLMAQSMEALVSWDKARNREQAVLVQEGKHSGEERLTDAKFIVLLKQRDNFVDRLRPGVGVAC
jgi:hypothetical protein